MTPKEGGIWQYLSRGFSLGEKPEVSLAAMQKCLDEFCVANGLETGKVKIIINTSEGPPGYDPTFAIAFLP